MAFFLLTFTPKWHNNKLSKTTKGDFKMITMEQIRINAVLGVCERQRELMLENRRLQKQLNRRFDDIGGMIGFTFAGLLILVCILL